MRHGLIGEFFKMKTMHLQSYKDFGVKKFGSPKTDFPIWSINFHLFFDNSHLTYKKVDCGIECFLHQ